MLVCVDNTDLGSYCNLNPFKYFIRALSLHVVIKPIEKIRLMQIKVFQRFQYLNAGLLSARICL